MSKTLIFKKDIFMRFVEESGDDFLKERIRKNMFEFGDDYWVNFCDGKEVEDVNWDLKVGRIGFYLVDLAWCEEQEGVSNGN